MAGRRKRADEPVIALRRAPLTRHVVQVEEYDPRTGRVVVTVVFWDGEREQYATRRVREKQLVLLRGTTVDDDRERLAGVLARRAVRRT